MRTSVSINPSDPDETDEFPGCGAMVTEEGGLDVCTHPELLVEAQYGPEEWVSVYIANE